MESVEINKGKCNKMSSFFVCFKAIVDANDDFKPTRRKRNPSSDPVLAYMATADKDGVVLFSSASKEECSRCRKRAREAWYALKMAINDTPLIKKIFSRRKSKKDSMSRINTKPEIIDKHKTIVRANSNTSLNNIGSSTVFSSSSSLNSITSSYPDHMPNSSSLEINNIPKPPPLNETNGVSKKISSVVEDRRKRNIALCMLWIINLLVLIFWGKFFAILCTSIWLYFVPYHLIWKCKEGVSSYKESEFDSVRYKKKIMMDRILERSHDSLLNSANSTTKS